MANLFKGRQPVAALALSTDTSALTCIGNDYLFAEAFSRQVRALDQHGGCLLGLGGGKLADMCDCSIVVPSDGLHGFKRSIY